MKRILVDLLRFTLAGVFLWAAFSKIPQPHEFATAVFRYQLLPHALVNVFALYLPWLELVIAFALINWRGLREAAALGYALLTALFTAAIISTIARDINISCGCFSSSGVAASDHTVHLVGNIALICSALYLFFAARKERLAVNR